MPPPRLHRGPGAAWRSGRRVVPVVPPAGPARRARERRAPPPTPTSATSDERGRAYPSGGRGAAGGRRAPSHVGPGAGLRRALHGRRVSWPGRKPDLGPAPSGPGPGRGGKLLGSSSSSPAVSASGASRARGAGAGGGLRTRGRRGRGDPLSAPQAWRRTRCGGGCSAGWRRPGGWRPPRPMRQRWRGCPWNALPARPRPASTRRAGRALRPWRTVTPWCGRSSSGSRGSSSRGRTVPSAGAAAAPPSDVSATTGRHRRSAGTWRGSRSATRARPATRSCASPGTTTPVSTCGRRAGREAED